MNKRIFALFFVLVLLLSTCGCQLAKPDGDISTTPDRLVGAFITTEYIDTIDWDSLLQSNIDDELLLNSTSSYQQRLYGEYSAQPYQDSTGQTHTRDCCTFPGLEGMVLAHYLVNSTEGIYYATDVGEGISHVHSIVGGSDQGISGTIWVKPNSRDIIFYMNPMYQTQDGEIYLLPGSGLHMSGDAAGQATQTLSETFTVTENGKTEESSFEVEVTIDIAMPAETVTILQMNGQNTQIGKETYLADQLPDAITPNQETVYLIVEIQTETGIQRQLIEPEEDSISVFIPLDTQICTQDHITVHW